MTTLQDVVEKQKEQVKELNQILENIYSTVNSAVGYENKAFDMEIGEDKLETDLLKTLIDNTNITEMIITSISYQQERLYKGLFNQPDFVIKTEPIRADDYRQVRSATPTYSITPGVGVT